MDDTRTPNGRFQQGDDVVLVHGSYQGTQGIFFRLKKDANWADITEHNGAIRSHPVEWLAHSQARSRGEDGLIEAARVCVDGQSLDAEHLRRPTADADYPAKNSGITGWEDEGGAIPPSISGRYEVLDRSKKMRFASHAALCENSARKM